MTYVDTTGPNIVSICRGVGMLEEAIKCVFPNARTICSSDWESFANAAYLARMEEQTVEEHPVWCGDIAGLRLHFLRGLVDIFAAGLPCQPYSLAGSRDGNIDRRSWGNGDGPVPHCLRLISECQPSLVWIENVSAWVRSREQWFRPFGEELCRMGYEIAEPVFISASDVGASHGRERVFILAYSKHRARGSQFLVEAGERFGSGARGGAVGNSKGITGGTGPSEGDSEHDGDGAGIRSSLVGDASGSGAAAAEQRGRALCDKQAGCSVGDAASLLDAGKQQPRTGSAGLGSGEMGDPALGGLGKLREPSASDGQSDRPGEAVADAERVQPAIHEGIGTRPGETPRARAPSESPGCGSSLELADAERERVQGHARHGDSGDQSRRQRTRTAGPACASSTAVGPIFAPGPTDPRWPAIIEAFPHLAPAVKPRFRMFFDGLPMVVDQSRADQLRCSGNGVVPAQASVALVEALRRARLI